jgi:hypothetical protein
MVNDESEVALACMSRLTRVGFAINMRMIEGGVEMTVRLAIDHQPSNTRTFIAETFVEVLEKACKEVGV